MIYPCGNLSYNAVYIVISCHGYYNCRLRYICLLEHIDIRTVTEHCKAAEIIRQLFKRLLSVVYQKHLIAPVAEQTCQAGSQSSAADYYNLLILK